jgi:hypothetical protein
MEGVGAINEISLEQKKEYEERIWQRAEEFSVIRNALQKKLDELDALFKEKPLESLNLYEQEKRRAEEDEYWRTQEKINEIKTEEDKLEKILADLDQGTITLADLEVLLPKQNEEEKHISKRKQKILEEKKRLGIDPRQIMGEMYGEFGNEKMHLTTGRHATGVKNLGLVDPLFAAAEFYYATTDTHGGKVAYGKRGDTYVSVSGKRIRKK